MTELEEEFDDCVRIAIQLGKKYMPDGTHHPTTEEWNLALLLLKEKCERGRS